MTTISYHHGDREIAIDSRTTAGGLILDNNCLKTIKTKVRQWFFCGPPSEFELFIDEFEKRDLQTEFDCSAFIIESDIAYLITTDNGKFHKYKMNHNHSIGCGCDFALAAMDFGKSAKDAVKYAMTRDVYTGGRVRVFKVGS